MVYPYTFSYEGYNETRTGGTTKVFPPDETLLPRDQLNVLHYVFDEWSTYDLIYYNDNFKSPFVYENGLFVYFLNEPISNNKYAYNVKASLFERWCYETYGFPTAYYFFNTLLGVLFEDLYQLISRKMVYYAENILLEQYTGEPKFRINNEYPYHLFFYELDSDNSFKITRLDIPPNGLVDLTDRKIHYASMHFYVHALEDLSVFDELPNYIKRLGMDGDYFKNKIPSNNIINLKEVMHKFTLEITGHNTHYVSYNFQYSSEQRIIYEPIGKPVLIGTISYKQVDLTNLDDSDNIEDEYLFYGLITAKNNFLKFDVELPPSYDEYSYKVYPYSKGSFIYWLPMEHSVGETLSYKSNFYTGITEVLEVKFGDIIRDFIGSYLYTCDGVRYPTEIGDYVLTWRENNNTQPHIVYEDIFSEWTIWETSRYQVYSPTWTVYEPLSLNNDGYVNVDFVWSLNLNTATFFEKPEPNGVTSWHNVSYMDGNVPVESTYSYEQSFPGELLLNCNVYSGQHTLGLVPLRHIERSRLTRKREKFVSGRRDNFPVNLTRIDENAALSIIDVERYEQKYEFTSLKSVEECWRFYMPDSIRVKEIYEICYKLQRINGMKEYEPFLESSYEKIQVLPYDEYNNLSSEKLKELKEDYEIWSLLHPNGEIKWGKKGIMYVPISRRFVEDLLEKEISIKKNPLLLVHDYLQLMFAILTDINNGLDLGALSANITPDDNTELCKHKGLRDLLSDIFYNVTTANNYSKKTFISSILCQDHLKELIKITGLPVLNKPISSNNQGATIISLAFEEDVPTFYLVLCNILDNIGILIAHLLKEKIKEKEDAS